MRGVRRRVWIGDGGFVGFFMVVCGGLMADCGGGIALCSGFLNFFFLFILRSSKHCKIFFRLFSKMQPNIGKKIIFLEIIYICKHFTVKNNLQRNKRSLSVSSNTYEPILNGFSWYKRGEKRKSL
jgi:hypothetical protein